MTTAIIPEFVNPPKEGARSGSIKATDGRYYGFEAKKYPTSSWEKGKTYNVELKSREYNGKTYWDITARHEGTAPRSNGAGPPPLVDRFWMPFVSNVVAHAIAGGQVKDPAQVFNWAMAAKQAALALDKIGATDDPVDREPGDDYP
jgi:hypothetical protein